MALRWTSALLKIFSQSVHFQGGEPCPKKPGHLLRISVHIREEQSFDLFFFISCDGCGCCVRGNICRKSSLWQGKS